MFLLFFGCVDYVCKEILWKEEQKNNVVQYRHEVEVEPSY